MNENTFTATSSIVINSPVHEVWNALVSPEMIKQYFFGTEALSDWEIGSEIIFTGEWEGNPYQEKGVILEKEENKRLVTNYWSPTFGEETEENFQKVSYELEEVDGKTKLTITQEKIPTAQSRDQSKGNWDLILIEIKKLLETPKAWDQPKLAA